MLAPLLPPFAMTRKYLEQSQTRALDAAERTAIMLARVHARAWPALPPLGEQTCIEAHVSLLGCSPTPPAYLKVPLVQLS